MNLKARYPKITKSLEIIIRRYNQANVSNNAIVLAYYALMSIAPIILIAGNLIARFDLKSGQILAYAQEVIPSNVYQTFKPILVSFLSSGSSSSLSIGILVTIWSASKIIAAIRRSLNEAYGVDDAQGAILTRIIAFFLTLGLLLLIVGLAIFFTLSQVILDLVLSLTHLTRAIIPNWINQLLENKNLITFVGMFVVAMLLYYFVPNAQVKLRYIWIGALVTTIGWIVISQGFRIYIELFAKRITSYQTIGSLIVLMFWLNFSGILLMFGGVVNASVQEWFEEKIEPKSPRVMRRIFYQFFKRNKNKSPKA
ncbi:MULTISPECIES: YihY/virulence factor BrkB family protein [Lactiplantibacillus]|uniref:YihY/virulence factor BrkB family protein n=1 Tax=Lactiplantibacillus pentosus TaxID=1589 RepID=A0AAW8WHT3_LACPE|nr:MULTISPECIES: YihY/virulence factor BrkB family protein [Lactiplantibacillus]MBU7460193.1 YihY/virulence factor BrkB family protein [Lactiplantibacillus pentosus]MBU7477442.1 YihY/virulence factor BrkB family protein [Lactiplantibacillus pentosus]MBU7482893.1 YihY/virulence factor BrkB family protein [Lactiplantibacillus sp. 30.2.29]MBU7486952.1 YihY/virulence factor BrkB family protein [Lactiplantibacillus pentosus]MBU7500057.1 YihY/virulence factor BrkB family protein [Lactiplantibacillus